MMIGKGKERCSPSASAMFGGSKQQSGRNYRVIIQLSGEISHSGMSSHLWGMGRGLASSIEGMYLPFPEEACRYHN